MSSTTETPTATFERSKTKVLPVTENSTAENDTAVTEAADAIETPEPSVVDESPTPDAKPVHTWGVLPVVEQDMPLPDIDDVTSNAGSDAIPINKSPTNPSSGDEVDSGDGNADGKSDTKSVKCDSPGDEAIALPNNKESDATAPIPDAGCTEGAFDAGVGGEGETSDKTDNAEDSACAPNEKGGPVSDSPTKAFFTDDIRGRALDTIHEHGSVNLKFGEYADLFVEVKGADGCVHVFEVQSDVLAAASTEFHKMVYDTHKRGNKAEWKAKWVWELTDSAIGLKVLFSILHHKYVAALFSRQPQPQQIYDVLRTLSKYAISDEAYHPMVKSWIAGFRKGLADSALTQLERLYVSYKLGDFRTLKVCLRKVANTVEVGEGGVLILDGKSIQEIVSINDELVANIRAVRNVDIKNLTEPLQKAKDSLMGEVDDGTDFCISSEGHDECNEKMCGSLLANLRKQGFRPIPSAAAYTGTVSELAAKISEMEIRGLYVPGLAPHLQLHSLCKLNQDKVAKDILSCNAYLPLYDDLVEHMVLSTRRAGVAMQEKDSFEDYKAVFNAASAKYKEEVRQSFSGWDEGIESIVSDGLFPVDDDSGIGEGPIKIWHETVPFQ